MSAIISRIAGRGIPLRGNDIDTDRIIPARFLRCVTFDGLGAHAFEDDRQQLARAGKQHPFDEPRFSDGIVLVVNGNFGCGSSREHAPQALAKWGKGIKAIVGVSFSEIFSGNCTAMGLPCLRISQADADAIQTAIEADPAVEVVVDLNDLSVAIGSQRWSAQLADAARKQFLTGQWDALGELVDGLPQVKATAARLPYLNAFAS